MADLPRENAHLSTPCTFQMFVSARNSVRGGFVHWTGDAPALPKGNGW